MAQTKRKRQSKHRGNAAGMIESRGRTGRKATPEERKAAPEKGGRTTRFDEPPTWKGAFFRALLAVAFFAVLVIALFGQNPVNGAILAIVMIPLYTVLGFYTDRWLYGRRMRSKAAK